MANRAVFLDRDNTLIHNDGDLGDPDKVVLIQGAASAIASLRGLGYRIVVVTNQGGVARGKYTEADVDAVHQRIVDKLKPTNNAIVDRFYYCPFHPEAVVDEYRREHPWRKPAPGMLLQAIEDLNLDPAGCWMIGDQLRDVEAGHAAGVRSILLSKTRPVIEPGVAPPEAVVANLVEATRVIAQRRNDRDSAKIHSGGESAIVDPPPRPTQPANTPPEPPQSPAPPKSPESDKPQTPPSEPRKPTRPFKPWTIQPVVVPIEKKPSSTHPVVAPPDSPAAESVDDFDDDATSLDVPPPPPPAVTNDQQVELLRQIVRQLKHRHADHGDFSLKKMLAAVFQMLAVGCVLFALFNYTDAVTFLQWMAGGLLSQLCVITLLILHWQE
ncbi:HAD-IIIA family hydrolase [Planctomycetales bacterium ZRK34]|nr:HAD-IIIA family hydrolase [Planctomycetales bacterium ZRK34]